MGGTSASEHASGSLEAAKIIASLAWPLLVAIILLFLRSDLVRLVGAITSRVVEGARIKTPWLELENVKVSQQSGKVEPPRDIEVGQDHGGLLRANLADFDRTAHYVMIAHQLFPSELGENILDILIFIKPLAENDWLREVAFIEYFFGFNDEDTVFMSRNFGKNFPV